LLWIVARWRPRFRFSKQTLRELSGFAGFLFGENLLYQGTSSLGPLLVGRVLGAAALGIYGLASNVILVPITRLVAPLAQVVFPAFARISDDRERLSSAWLRASALISGLACPALVGLAIVAPDFVPTVLGSRWSESVLPIALLATAGAIQTFGALFPDVMLAVNRPGDLFRVTAAIAAAGLVALVVGMHWGIVGVAASLTFSSAVSEPFKLYVASHILNLPLRRVSRAFAGVAVAVTTMAVSVALCREVLVIVGMPTAPRLFLSVLIGCASYLGACSRYAPEIMSEVRQLLRDRRAASQTVDPLAA
jgi:O-antigen/teichoic acid export membrane protein